MSNVIVTIQGEELLIKKLDHISDDLSGRALENATRQATMYLFSLIPPYPPPRPQQKYIRTGLLGRSFYQDVKPIGGGAVGTVGNSVPYGPWVISSEPIGNRGPQAWMHVGRWYTLQGVADKAKDTIKKIYSDWLKRLVES